MKLVYQVTKIIEELHGRNFNNIVKLDKTEEGFE